VTETETGNTWRQIRVFLLLTLGFSAVFWACIVHTGRLGAGHGLYVTGLMWSPGVAALITRLLYQGTTRDVGWQWGRTRYQVFSYLIPVGYAFIVYAVVWVTQLGGFYDVAFINAQAADLGWSALAGPLQLLMYALVAGTIGMASSCATALGEEIGWRGFLVPQLAKVTSFTKLSLLSGFIWSLWHYPILLFADYNSGTPAWYALTCFTLMVVGISFIFAWMRLKSGSVWTGMFLHASHNLWIQGIFDPLTRDTGKTRFVIGEFGIGLAVAAVVVAFITWRRRGEVSGGSCAHAVYDR
jgi:membrane protease YdiL (CAAX protease family)